MLMKLTIGVNPDKFCLPVFAVRLECLCHKLDEIFLFQEMFDICTLACPMVKGFLC